MDDMTVDLLVLDPFLDSTMSKVQYEEDGFAFFWWRLDEMYVHVYVEPGMDMRKVVKYAALSVCCHKDKENRAITL